MNAYRLSGTVSADRTITVQVPEASVGQDAEVIVLFSQPIPLLSAGEHPLRRFLDDLRAEPGQQSTADEEQAFLRQLKDE